MDNNIVKKSHFMISSRFNDLTPRERDLLTLIIKRLNQDSYQIHIGKKKTLSLQYEFSITELKNLFPNQNKEALSRSLKSAARTLKNKEGEINNGNDWILLQLIHTPRFIRGEFKFEVPKLAANRILDFSKGYSETDMRLSLSLSGGAEKCILDMISQFKDSKSGYFNTIENFCKIIGTDINKYKDFKSFRVTQLDRPIKRLIAASNGMWTAKEGYPKGYTISKTGRAYKDTDIITFKLHYTEPVTATKPKTDTKTTESDLIPLEAVYDTIMNGFTGKETLGELGLNKKSIDVFIAALALNPQYLESLGNLHLILNNTRRSTNRAQ